MDSLQGAQGQYAQEVDVSLTRVSDETSGRAFDSKDAEECSHVLSELGAFCQQMTQLENEELGEKKETIAERLGDQLKTLVHLLKKPGNQRLAPQWINDIFSGKERDKKEMLSSYFSIFSLVHRLQTIDPLICLKKTELFQENKSADASEDLDDAIDLSAVDELSQILSLLLSKKVDELSGDMLCVLTEELVKNGGNEFIFLEKSSVLFFPELHALTENMATRIFNNFTWEVLREIKAAMPKWIARSAGVVHHQNKATAEIEKRISLCQKTLEFRGIGGRLSRYIPDLLSILISPIVLKIQENILTKQEQKPPRRSNEIPDALLGLLKKKTIVGDKEQLVLLGQELILSLQEKTDKHTGKVSLNFEVCEKLFCLLSVMEFLEIEKNYQYINLERMLRQISFDTSKTSTGLLKKVIDSDDLTRKNPSLSGVGEELEKRKQEIIVEGRGHIAYALSKIPNITNASTMSQEELIKVLLRDHKDAICHFLVGWSNAMSLFDQTTQDLTTEEKKDALKNFLAEGTNHSQATRRAVLKIVRENLQQIEQRMDNQETLYVLQKLCAFEAMLPQIQEKRKFFFKKTPSCTDDQIKEIWAQTLGLCHQGTYNYYYKIGGLYSAEKLKELEEKTFLIAQNEEAEEISIPQGKNEKGQYIVPGILLQDIHRNKFSINQEEFQLPLNERQQFVPEKENCKQAVSEFIKKLESLNLSEAALKTAFGIVNQGIAASIYQEATKHVDGMWPNQEVATAVKEEFIMVSDKLEIDIHKKGEEEGPLKVRAAIELKLVLSVSLAGLGEALADAIDQMAPIKTTLSVAINEDGTIVVKDYSLNADSITPKFIEDLCAHVGQKSKATKQSLHFAKKNN